MGYDEERGRGGRHERLDRLASRDVEVVRRLIEEEQVGWLDAQQRKLQPRPLPAGQQADLLERVIATEQEAREVRASLAVCRGVGRHERIEDGGTGESGTAELGEIADLDGVAEDDGPIERRQVPRDRPQQGRLAGAVRADDADPLAALGGQERSPCDGLRLGRRRTVGRQCASPGEVADGQALDAHDDLARPRRPRPGQGRGRDRQLAAGLGGLLSLRLQALEPCFVLVHLAELAMAPVALDELLLAGDRLGLGLDVLDGPRIALLTLAVKGAVVPTERREVSVAQLPDAVDGGVQERPIVRRHDE